VCEQQIGAFGRRFQVIVGGGEHGHDQLAHHVLRSVARVVDATRDLGVRPEVIEVGPYRRELQASLFDIRAITAGCGDDDDVAALHQATAERQVRVQIAVRAEGGDDDAQGLKP